MLVGERIMIYFEFNLLNFHYYEDQWWFGVLGVEYGDFDGHLFFIEKCGGCWKFDLLWLRYFYYGY